MTVKLARFGQGTIQDVNIFISLRNFSTLENVGKSWYIKILSDFFLFFFFKL